jgi:hypothetical protein
MGTILRPDVWQANKVYYRRDDDTYDLVLPTVFTGLYYWVKHPGKSGATEPAWVQKDEWETVDSTNGLVWQAAKFNLMPPGVDISAVTLTATSGVTLSGKVELVNSFTYFIDIMSAPTKAAVAAAGQVFDVTARVTKTNGGSDDYTFRFKVAEK